MNYSRLKITILLLVILSPSRLFAAEIVLDSVYHSKEKVQINVYLRLEDETVNVVEGEVLLPNEVLLDSITEENSIVSMWAQSPSVYREGVISFRGVIPGGYKELHSPLGKQEKGVIFSFLITSPNLYGKKIVSTNSRVAMHDGAGTIQTINPVNFYIPAYQGEVVATTTEDFLDTTPPLPFKVELIKSDYLYDGKWVAVFNARDSESGIDHYEIKEGDRDFIRAVSPYPLVNQELGDTIFVRAIDRAGNETLSVVSIPSSNFLFYLICIFVAIVILFSALFIIWIKRKKEKFLVNGSSGHL